MDNTGWQRSTAEGSTDMKRKRTRRCCMTFTQVNHFTGLTPLWISRIQWSKAHQIHFIRSHESDERWNVEEPCQTVSADRLLYCTGEKHQNDLVISAYAVTTTGEPRVTDGTQVKNRKVVKTVIQTKVVLQRRHYVGFWRSTKLEKPENTDVEVIMSSEYKTIIATDPSSWTPSIKCRMYISQERLYPNILPRNEKVSIHTTAEILEIALLAPNTSSCPGCETTQIVQEAWSVLFLAEVLTVPTCWR